MYDGLNRVIEIDHPTPLGPEYFQYDAFGNLVGKKDGNGLVTAYEYDDLNRLVAAEDREFNAPVAVWFGHKYKNGEKLLREFSKKHPDSPPEAGVWFVRNGRASVPYSGPGSRPAMN